MPGDDGQAVPPRRPHRRVPISYHLRGVSAGKKIGWRDAVQTVWTLIRWRLTAR